MNDTPSLPIGNILDAADAQRISDLELYQDTDGNLYVLSESLQEREEVLRVDSSANISTLTGDGISELASELTPVTDIADQRGMSYD